jgi:hypothetical protein
MILRNQIIGKEKVTIVARPPQYHQSLRHLHAMHNTTVSGTVNEGMIV